MKKNKLNMSRNEIEVKENIYLSLDEQIKRVETSLNTITEKLRKLKEKKQAIQDTSRNEFANSSVEESSLVSRKRKKYAYVTLDCGDSEESTIKKKKISEREYSENGHEMVENETTEPTTKKEKKSKRELIENGHEMVENETTIINNLESVENTETKKSKKEKQTHKNGAEILLNEVHIENPDMSEDTATKKSKKKKKKDDETQTIPNDSSNLECTENSLNVETKKSKKKHKKDIDELENVSKITNLNQHLKKRVEIIKSLVSSITRQTTPTEEKQSDENYLENSHSVSHTSHNNQNNFNNSHNSYVPEFGSNNSYQPSNQYRFYNSNNNSDQMNERFYKSVRPAQKVWRKEKKHLRDEIKSGMLRLDFKGANISSIIGYGERVHNC